MNYRNLLLSFFMKDFSLFACAVANSSIILSSSISCNYKDVNTYSNFKDKNVILMIIKSTHCADHNFNNCLTTLNEAHIFKFHTDVNISPHHPRQMTHHLPHLLLPRLPHCLQVVVFPLFHLYNSQGSIHTIPTNLLH